MRAETENRAPERRGISGSGTDPEIYVHIPFCVKKCAYCDFLSFPAGAELQRQYVDALLGEIRGSSSGDPVRSIFFGGGTPSLLPAEWVAEILQTIGKCFCISSDAEITIEANPGTVDLPKLRIYRQAGINRISFGCQSFHDEELRILGRIHTAEEIRGSVDLAGEAGFSNINLDLISGVPGQSLSAWEDSLRQAVSLSPEHISAYSLIIEEGTPFSDRYGDSSACGKGPAGPPLPDEETERMMYARTGEILAEAGYRQYEISNYAKEGFACRHNIGYWTGVPYYGFGLGAAGFLPYGEPERPGIRDTGQPAGWMRRTNTRSMREYLNGDRGGVQTELLDAEDLQAEFMILGLRMTGGVEDAEFLRRFGKSLDQVYGAVLEKYVGMGLLIRENGRTRLSPAGISVSNPILAEFL